MWEICIRIHGRLHCFPVPELVQNIHIPGQGPVNFPEFELAAAVLKLVDAVGPITKGSALTKQLAEVATSFIQQVQKGVPEGVEIKQTIQR